jgi:hypothetical protein
MPCVGVRGHTWACRKCQVMTAHVPSLFGSYTHGNPKFRSGDSGRLAQGGSGRAVPCVGAPAHVAVPKFLSRHGPCAFCTFVQPVCPTLPRAFVRVVHPWKPQISFAACTHGNPKFRSGGSGRVVCGCPCKRVRASRVGSGRAVPRVGAREHVAAQKMIGRDHPCASCTFARPVCLTLRPAFVRAGRVLPCVGARAHVAVPKMLSHDPPCAFYTFVRPVCPTLPCAFVRVAHPWKPQISFGLCI